MSEFKHKKVVTEHYEINLGGYHRTISGLINKFLDGMPDVEDEDAWQESHVANRDCDGDLDGIVIYQDPRIEPIIKFIFEKIGVNYDDFRGIPIHLVS